MLEFRLRYSALFFLLALTAACLQAQSIPRRTDADNLLRDAVRSQDLQAARNPFFRIQAQFRFEDKDTAQEGEYELLWAGPKRFRETLHLGDVAEVDFALADKIYISRTPQTLMPHIRYLECFIHHPFQPSCMGWYALDSATVSKVYVDKSSSIPSFCFEPGDLRDSKICFETATREMLSVHSCWGQGTNASSCLEEKDFMSAGNLRYPGRIVFHTKDSRIEVHVEKFETVTEFAPDAFVPPANSESRDWCLHPTVRMNLGSPSTQFPKTDPRDAFYPMYILTRPDGHIEKFVSLNPSAPKLDGAVEKWIQTVQLPVLMCGEKPIPNEFIETHR
jgi:hypothetical protein